MKISIHTILDVQPVKRGHNPMKISIYTILAVQPVKNGHNPLKIHIWRTSKSPKLLTEWKEIKLYNVTVDISVFFLICTWKLWKKELDAA